MNPYSRMMWTLAGALLIWVPVALGVLDNKIELATGGLYFLGALAISYVGVGVISYMTNNYRETAHRLQFAKYQIQEIERRNTEEEHNRRANDEGTNGE